MKYIVCPDCKCHHFQVAQGNNGIYLRCVMCDRGLDITVSFKLDVS